jgi:hypothetical protein
MSPTGKDNVKPAAVKVNLETKFSNEKQNLHVFIEDKIMQMKQEKDNRKPPP